MKQQLTPILLPTDDDFGIYKQPQPYIGMICKAPNGRFFIYERPPSFGGNYQFQHLYLVSNVEFTRQEACWHYNHVFKTISNESSTGYAKVIASTDSSLNLPSIPQDFIKYFVEKQGNVKSVSIEMEEIKTGWLNDNDQMLEVNTGRFQLKLTKNNEVIIVLEEKSYTEKQCISAVVKTLKNWKTSCIDMKGNPNIEFLAEIELELRNG